MSPLVKIGRKLDNTLISYFSFVLQGKRGALLQINLTFLRVVACNDAPEVNMPLNSWCILEHFEWDLNEKQEQLS